ncbi:MAG: nucleotidyltransferase family protein [Pseudomonadota bacterium]
MSLSTAALILLASGRATRFGADKLMASLDGAPVLSRAADLGVGDGPIARLAVVAPDQTERRALLSAKGWTLIDNPHPEHGQSEALKYGIDAALDTPAERFVVVLGDMPFVIDSHLSALAGAVEKGADAAISLSGGQRMAPAAFARRTAPILMTAAGDAGAGPLLKQMNTVVDVPMAPENARDIDTPSDLSKAEAAYG